MNELSPEAREFFRLKGQEGGLKRNKNLSPERRKELSILANQAKKKKK